jgi:ABC-type Fe3+/spermidine/putrescine transport system ATPase subunit
MERMRSLRAPAIEVIDLGAGYVTSLVVKNVSLSVAPGEFVAILGSSGCGKTTLLRTIAGFQKALAGSVLSFGRDITGLAPERREVAMVFQSYALWPHMTVLGNIGYGLRLRGQPRGEISKRVKDILAMLGMSGLEDRGVTELSGGQRQRVALGRALAIEPQVLLLDEPLSNLDAKVRIQLRAEIKTLQARLGFAALHVTHDREEAMTMADRIVVMDQGSIAQVGPPDELYHAPASPFVAAFMGADNTISLKIRQGSSGLEVEAGPHHAATPIHGAMRPGPIIAYFRDDAARLEKPDHRSRDEIVLRGSIALRSYPGGHYRYAVAVGEREFTVRDTRLLEIGTPVGLCLPTHALHLFPDGASTKSN